MLKLATTAAMEARSSASQAARPGSAGSAAVGDASCGSVIGPPSHLLTRHHRACRILWHADDLRVGTWRVRRWRRTAAWAVALTLSAFRRARVSLVRVARHRRASQGRCHRHVRRARQSVRPGEEPGAGRLRRGSGSVGPQGSQRDSGRRTEPSATGIIAMTPSASNQSRAPPGASRATWPTSPGSGGGSAFWS